MKLEIRMILIKIMKIVIKLIRIIGKIIGFIKTVLGISENKEEENILEEDNPVKIITSSLNDFIESVSDIQEDMDEQDEKFEDTVTINWNHNNGYDFNQDINDSSKSTLVINANIPISETHRSLILEDTQIFSQFFSSDTENLIFNLKTKIFNVEIMNKETLSVKGAIKNVYTTNGHIYSNRELNAKSNLAKIVFEDSYSSGVKKKIKVIMISCEKSTGRPFMVEMLNDEYVVSFKTVTNKITKRNHIFYQVNIIIVRTTILDLIINGTIIKWGDAVFMVSEGKKSSKTGNMVMVAIRINCTYNNLEIIWDDN